MDQQLRLGATFQDGATPAIRKLKNEMAGVKVMPGMVAADEWMGKFTTKGAEFVRSGAGMADIFGAMGIAGLGAAASMVSLVGRFKELSEHVLNIKELGREVGLTTNKLNQFAQAGQKFGVGAEAIEGAIDAFKSQMPQFMRGYGHMMDELAQRAPNLVKALKLEDTEHQIKEIFGYLGKITDPQQQKQMADLFFPGHGADIEKLFAKGPKGFTDEVERMKQSLGPITEQMEKQAEELRKSTGDLNREFEKFELQVGPTFVGWMTDVVKEAESFFSTISKINNRDEGTYKENRKAQQDAEEAERKSQEAPPPKSNPSPMKRGDRLLKRMSYIEDGSDETSGGTSSSASGMLTEGVKQGVLAAFREWQAQSTVDGSGVQKASFGPGGGGGGGFGGGGGGGGGAGSGGSWGGRALGVGSGAGIGHTASKEQRASFIKAYASSIGIDPDTALRVAQSEGFNKYVGDNGTSFGDFQMHVGGGLGDRLRQMGIDPTDPKQWQKADKVALDIARKEGWGAWHGAAHVGIGNQDGIGVAPDGSALDAYNKRQWSAPGDVASSPHGRRALAAYMANGPRGSFPDWMSDRSKRELSTVNRELAENLLGASKASGVHFDVLQGLRTQEEANRNAANGSGVRNSQHLYGAAADLAMIDPATGQRTYDRGIYQRFAKAFREINAKRGTRQRWLGDSGGRWGSDIAHFDQGLGYGQSHQRNPYGIGGPTPDDINAGRQDAYRGPGNPFLHGRMPNLNAPDASSPPASADEGGSHHKLDIHIKDSGGNVRSASLRSTGDGMRTSLNRWSGMTEPSAVG